MPISGSSTHIFIPDTQIKPNFKDDPCPIDHLRWIGQYIVDQFHEKPNIKIIHIGDHWDMPSLSKYDAGKRAMEGRRYGDDIEAGNAGFDALNQALIKYNERKKKFKERQWWPERHFFDGNHEYRVVRATEDDPKLYGALCLSDMNIEAHGWKRHAFLEVATIDGIAYSHYFYNPMSGQPYGGMIETRLKSIGTSFSMGHQQTLLYGIRYVAGKSQHGLVAGSCYLHDENYKGPQGNAHWRGIIIKHQVRDGSYDPMFVSLEYLCERYEKKSLAEFRAKKGLRNQYEK